MPTNKINYRIYPSLLDAFHDFVFCDDDWNRYWGNSEEPPKTREEYAAECEAKLINMINRCPKEPILVADRGTAFNAVIDALNNPDCDTGDVKILGYIEQDNAIGISTKINGFNFIYDRQLCFEVASEFTTALSQYLCKAPLETACGVVELYGYIDKWVNDKIYDLKTTTSYQFGKYENKRQRFVYPYCVIESGMATGISEFIFYAVELHRLGNTDFITGKIYPESYTYNHQVATDNLRYTCESFICWLESRKEYITDQRIFGGENPAGYVGKPITFQELL